MSDEPWRRSITPKLPTHTEMESHIYHPQPSAFMPPQHYNFDLPSQSSVSLVQAPPPPPPPSIQSELFSASETTDFFGFLDGFDFDLGEQQLQQQQHQHYPITPPYPVHPTLATTQDSYTTQDTYAIAAPQPQPSSSQMPYMTSPSSLVIRTSPSSRVARTISSSPPQQLVTLDDPSKPLLSTPQKRLNHIMSEQKRRNAIRDCYADLINLVAPAGSQCAIAMPSRGRPKGSGNRNKNKTQGKSGVLFRAVEYIKFLEENRDALRQEVERLEQAAGILHQS